MRVAAQKPASFFIENCDYVLESNAPTSEEFRQRCKAFFTEMLSKTNQTA